MKEKTSSKSFLKLVATALLGAAVLIAINDPQGVLDGIMMCLF